MTLPQSDAIVVESLTVSQVLTVAGSTAFTSTPVVGTSGTVDVENGVVTLSSTSGGNTSAVEVSSAGISLESDTGTTVGGGLTLTASGDLTLAGGGISFDAGVNSLSTYTQQASAATSFGGAIVGSVGHFIDVVRVGVGVTLAVPAFSAPVVGGNSVITATIPSGYRPTSILTALIGVDNGAGLIMGSATLDTDGVLIIGQGFTPANFTAGAGSVGFSGFSLSYQTPAEA